MAYPGRCLVHVQERANVNGQRTGMPSQGTWLQDVLQIVGEAPHGIMERTTPACMHRHTQT